MIKEKSVLFHFVWVTCNCTIAAYATVNNDEIRMTKTNTLTGPDNVAANVAVVYRQAVA